MFISLTHQSIVTIDLKVTHCVVSYYLWVVPQSTSNTCTPTGCEYLLKEVAVHKDTKDISNETKSC